jgi:phage baseplate assembly protein W
MIKTDAIRRDEIEISSLFDWPTLRDILIRAAIDDVAKTNAGFRIIYENLGSDIQRAGTKITIVQEKEGSPEYSVQQWQARVSIVFDVPGS